jgi:hypothetical protein
MLEFIYVSRSPILGDRTYSLVMLNATEQYMLSGGCGCSRRFEDQQAKVKGREDIKLARGLELFKLLATVSYG